VEDDGVGLSEDELVEEAVRRGIVGPEEKHSLKGDAIRNLVFLPGFTTRDAITDLSGRGVGLDVVKTNIARLGGVVQVHSEHGTGTKFVITLPITLAITRALVVGVGEERFALPIASVVEVLRLDRGQCRTVHGRDVLTLRGKSLFLCRLGQQLGLASAGGDGPRYCVVTQVGGRRLGFAVDRLFGQEDVIVKGLGRGLPRVAGIAGAAELGEQRVALVLDGPGLLEEYFATRDRSAEEGL
jgi:two-component system chemotaxis sensor kinase CheA